MTIQPTDAFKQVRVPQPSHAQPGGSSWRNRFAANPVSHGLRHLASVGKSPPLRLTPSRSRGRACPPVLRHQLHRVLHSRHAQAASPPYRRATLAGRTVRFVHAPAPADRPLAAPKRLFKYWQKLDGPAMHGRMVNRNSSLGHHLLEVRQTQRIRNVPAHTEKDYIERIVQALEHLRHSRIQVLLRRSDRPSSGLQHSRSLIATKPAKVHCHTATICSSSGPVPLRLSGQQGNQSLVRGFLFNYLSANRIFLSFSIADRNVLDGIDRQEACGEKQAHAAISANKFRIDHSG